MRNWVDVVTAAFRAKFNQLYWVSGCEKALPFEEACSSNSRTHVNGLR